MRVALTTLGCKVNQFETEMIEGLFVERGYQPVSFDQLADVYVINTCSVTHIGEKKSRQLIRRAVRLNPAAVIVVTGCYAQLAPEQIAAIDGVDVIIGTQQRQQIVDLAEQASLQRQQVTAVKDILSNREFEDIPLLLKPGRTRAFLKIQEGCDNYCTYCIIPYARGHLRSRPLKSVITEANKLINAGFKELVLTGIHLGAYGKDLTNINLADAVAAIIELPGLTRLRLSSLESVEVSPSLIELMLRHEKLCRHLHLPLQAGSDAVLTAMNRKYTTAAFKHQLSELMAKIPDIAVTTDVIVGFPGETRELFLEGLEFISALPLAKIHVFPYSPRQGTPAACYPNQVEESEKKWRVHQLQAVSERLGAEFRQRYLGSQLSVLFETQEQGWAEGFTTNYLRVVVESEQALAGQIYDVHLISTSSDHLVGRLK